MIKKLIQIPSVKVLLYTWILSIVMLLGSCIRITDRTVCRIPGGQRFDIDLPEEWQALSTDSIHPDTLIAYKDSNQVVHISFTGKYK